MQTPYLHPLYLLLITQIRCEQTTTSIHTVPLWQKICLIFGVVLIMIAGALYATRRRNIDMRELLRGYIVPAQAEVTFVNFKNDERGTQTVIETSHTADKSFDDDNNYLSKDEQLSIGGAETQNRHLSSVFEQKQGSKIKKSKTRKRLAAAAKLSTSTPEEQNSQISQDGDL